MKKYKTLYLLILISVIILSSVSGYHWWQNRNSSQQVGYISDSNWSRPDKLTTGVNTNTYKVLKNKGEMSVFWTRKELENKFERLYAKKLDFQGQVIQEEILVAEDIGLRAFTVEFLDGNYHLFWTSGKEGDLALRYWKMDSNFEILDRQTVTEGLSYTRRMKSVMKDKVIYLTWLNSGEDNYDYAELASFNLENGQFISRTISRPSLHAGYSNLIVAEDEINLVWYNQDPDKLFSNTKVRNNKYQLFFQRFDLNLVAKTDRLLIDSAGLSSQTAPEIFYDGQKIHIIYSKYKITGSQEFKGTYLWHGTFAYDSPTEVNRHRLSGEFINYPDGLKKDGKYYLTYIDKDQRNSINLVELEKIDGSVTGQKLFSRQNKGFYSRLSTDGEGNLHLVWLQEEDSGRSLYHATTKYPEKPGFLETLGVSIEGTPLEILTVILYFFIFPVVKLIGEVRVIFIVFLIMLIFLVLNFMANRFKILEWFKKLNNAYLGFLTVVTTVLCLAYFKLGLGLIFYPGLPPMEILPIILFLATGGTLFYLYQIDYNKDIAFMIGTVISFIWLYWIVQANLIFYAYHYFL